MDRSRRGVAPAELLLAVVLLGILLTIAGIRYNRDLVRSKVSHSHSILRQTAAAIEAYHADNGAFPLVTYPPFASPPFTETETDLSEQFKVLPGSLTTPVAYLASDRGMIDPFRTHHPFDHPLAYRIFYLPSDFYHPSSPYHSSGSQATYQAQVRRYGQYVLHGAGPDGWFFNLPGWEGDYALGGWNLASYDPTNGLTSAGDIYRSHKSAFEQHR